jgi:hypothetical protein
LFILMNCFEFNLLHHNLVYSWSWLDF